jgi:predicted HAD superfamily Cof-like phosphohydrolase
MTAAELSSRPLARAVYLAAHLHRMVPRQVWLDSGGDDGQGHYEGDYRAEQVADEIHRLAAAAEDGRHDVQSDVEAFHVALGIPVGATPAVRRPELRANLIREEARETVEAIEAGDLVAAIDGLCDLLCVVYGAAAEFGVNLAPFWDEVHRSNMAKRGGPVREDGKVLKPPGWTPPDIAGVLARVTGDGP